MKILRILKQFKQNRKKKEQNLPDLFFFTDRKKILNIFDKINSLPKNCAIIIREYDLNDEERLKFAKKIVKIAKKRKLVTLLAKNLQLAIQAKTNGVHFSDKDKSWQKYLLHQNYNPNFILSCSCHDEKSLIRAHKYKINFIFLSPIFKTKSHINAKIIGYRKLREIIKKSCHKIYCLGGVNQNNLQLVKQTNSYGVGVINLIKFI